LLLLQANEIVDPCQQIGVRHGRGRVDVYQFRMKMSNQDEDVEVCKE